MTGRGVDQILPHPCDPCLHERYMDSAVDYVRLAEEATGAIPRPVGMSYVWGAALDELDAGTAGHTHHQSRNERHAQRRLGP